MFGPKMKAACPMCSCMLDSLNGAAVHASQHISLAVVAKSPLDRIRSFARERGWSRLRLISSAANKQIATIWRKRRRRPTAIAEYLCSPEWNNSPFLPYRASLAAPEPGQNQRHVDMIWPLWNLLDFTPEGRGADWYPSLTYPL
jgi:predicted dithiol-disulfide oxidoreductase (DUF899 family)